MGEEKKNLVANVLICLNLGGGASPEVAEKIRKVYEFKLQNNNRDDFGCGQVKTVYTLKDCNASLHEGKYDLLLIQETIEGERGVGVGTLKDFWRDYPNVKVFLLVDKRKKGQMKLYNLWTKGYFDVLYFQEIAENENGFFDVLINGRTKEEAFVYYGIEEIAEKMAEREKQDKASVEKKEESVKPKAEEVSEVPLEEPEPVAVEEAVSAKDTEKEEIRELEKELFSGEPDASMEEEIKTETPVEEKRMNDLPKEKPEEQAEEKEEKEIEKKETIPEQSVIMEESIEESTEEIYEEPVEETIPFLSEEQKEEYEYQYPQTYMDIDAMGVKAEVVFSFEGVISYIVSDNDVIIRCPKGGLLRNQEALKNAKIQLTWTEPY